MVKVYMHTNNQAPSSLMVQKLQCGQADTFHITSNYRQI